MEAAADSRSLVICAVRLGATGRGGAGAWLGVSRDLKCVWRALMFSSAVAMAGSLLEVVDRSFVVGSREMGR